MKDKIKVARYYYKVDTVIELLEQLRATGFKIAFDNTYTNNFKILYGGNEYSFRTYDDILSCLNLLLDIRKENKNDKSK